MRISNEGTVKITYCSSHYGHEPSLATANLSEKEYLLILDKLQRHTSDKDVLNEIHDEYEDKKSRMYYVDQDDIKNVRTKFSNLIETWRRWNKSHDIQGKITHTTVRSY
ncbi:hypothetical protein PRIPAC_82136, partial [Pristionchus pacificus]|uniref:Uncharacterized protein n=1 Tax=Pristionchus pacificus TaxID=54126 RepID=A0A2A6CQI9_PRIPA